MACRGRGCVTAPWPEAVETSPARTRERWTIMIDVRALDSLGQQRGSGKRQASVTAVDPNSTTGASA
jgi:hypothetical protein